MAVVGYMNLNKYNRFNFLGGLFGKNSDRRFVRATFGVRFLDVVNAIGGTRDINERIKEKGNEAPWKRLPGEKWGIIEIIPTLLSSLALGSFFLGFGKILYNDKLKLWPKIALFLPVVVPALVVWAVTFVAAQAIRATMTAIGFLTAGALTVTGILPLISIGARIYRSQKGIKALTFEKAKSLNYKNNQSYAPHDNHAQHHEYVDYSEASSRPSADHYDRSHFASPYGDNTGETVRQKSYGSSRKQDDIVSLDDGSTLAPDF